MQLNDIQIYIILSSTYLAKPSSLQTAVFYIPPSHNPQFPYTHSYSDLFIKDTSLCGTSPTTFKYHMHYPVLVCIQHPYLTLTQSYFLPLGLKYVFHQAAQPILICTYIINWRHQPTSLVFWASYCNFLHAHQ